MDLLSWPNWEERLTSYKQEKKMCSVFCICQCAVGIGMTCCIEMRLADGRGGCWKERRVWRMKVRQTTQNFFLLNFNLLDKNNSKWSTAYAWGRGGILSFFQETARLTELLIMSHIALSNSVSLIMAELSTPRHLRFHSCSPFCGLIQN